MEFCTNDTTLHPRQLDETGLPLIAYSKAMWIFTYGGGERVFAEGPLSIFFKPYGDGHFIIRDIAFDAIEHSSTRTGCGAQVESRVNFFGMPPSTLRCLDVRSVRTLGSLIYAYLYFLDDDGLLTYGRYNEFL